MSPKKSLIILASIALILAAGYLYLSGRKNYQAPNSPETVINSKQEAKTLDKIIEKKNDGNPLSENEEAVLDQAIDVKVQEKLNAVQAQAKSRSYTQDEIDVIMNPKKIIESEMGIMEAPESASKAVKPLNQEEINNIINPKN